MKLSNFLKVWFISYIGFFIVDMLTHAVILSDLLYSELGDVFRPMEDAIFPVMILQTIIISMGTTYLLYKTRSSLKDLQSTALTGAVIGLLIYGIHELSNYSSLIRWSSTVTVVHLVAGVIQMALIAIWITFVKEKFDRDSR